MAETTTGGTTRLGVLVSRCEFRRDARPGPVRHHDRAVEPDRRRQQTPPPLATRLGAKHRGL